MPVGTAAVTDTPLNYGPGTRRRGQARAVVAGAHAGAYAKRCETRHWLTRLPNSFRPPDYLPPWSVARPPDICYDRRLCRDALSLVSSCFLKRSSR